jgi:hypothetical protein
VLAVTPGLRERVRANRRSWPGPRGTWPPRPNNTHEVAQAVAPDSRIVYVDNDPIVLVHAKALLASGPQGATQYVDGDIRDPGPILRAAASTLDLSQPVGLMLLGILHLIQDSEDLYRVVADPLDGLPSGSYLALSHPASRQAAPRCARRLSRR